MTNVILPFLMSMLLGRTIDLSNYEIGGSVFDDADYVETPDSSIRTMYHVIQHDVFPYTFFGVPADIALRIKSDFLTSASGQMGLDGLLKDTSWKQTSVVVGVVSIYRTVNRSLKKDALPLNDWQNRIADTQTHYAESLFYGGWCAVLFRFQCAIPGDTKEVRNTLTETIGILGELNRTTIDLWNKGIAAINANPRVRGLVKASAHVYSTVALNKDITTPASLVDVLESLPEAVGPVGQPLYMNLQPLHDLDQQFPVIRENLDLEWELEKLDEMLDDVRTTKHNLMLWVKDTMAVFEDEEEERISILLQKLNDCIRAMTKVSGEASLFKDADKEAVHAAIQTYLGGLQKGIGTYNLEYRRMKEEIDAECQDSFLHKIRGSLRVYDNEVVSKGKVSEGLPECQRLCLTDDNCRAVGFADEITELDRTTGLYEKKRNQCWIYYRSTSTAGVYTPDGIYGDTFVYDRKCYF